MGEHKSIILIADDDPFGRCTLETLLDTPSYHLTFATNGMETLRIASECMPDLLLLDIMMPDMDGFEVCRRLRSSPRLADIPVIMVTSLDDRASRLQGIDSGADDLIAKPFDPVELRVRVRTITRLNRYRRLMREREKFERITELAPDGIVIVDTQGTIALTNSAFHRMLGISENATTTDISPLHGYTIQSLMQPVYVPLCNILLHDVAATIPAPTIVQGRRAEMVFVRSNGTSFPVEITAGQFTWNDQPAVQLIVRDSTERKQAEEALRQSEEHLRQSRDALRAIFDGIDNGLVLLTHDGHIRAINQTMCALFGQPATTLVGRTWQSACLLLAPPFPSDAALKTLIDGRTRRHREHVTRTDGTVCVLDIQLLPLPSHNTTTQFVDQMIIHVVDMTETVHMQELAVQNEHFAARERIAASLAHEINTPLQSIQHCLYLATHRDNESEPYINVAREELDRISRIVRQLLTLKPFDEESMATHVNLNTLIERVLLLTGGTLASHGIDVARHLSLDSPMVQCYANQLTQVLLNIILNAMDAMPDGGILTITTSKQKGDVPHSDDNHHNHNNHHDTAVSQQSMVCIVTIADTGHGIPTEVQSQLFEPFYTTKPNGSGIGLAISQQIISQHGGEISVQSTLGAGSTFRIALPLTEPNEP